MPFVNNRSASYHWDAIQHMDRVTDDGGIIWYDCVSHGGFGLTNRVYEEMPRAFKNMSFTEDQFFEEDESFCAVVLWQPYLFRDKPELIRAAMLAYFNNYHRLESTRLHSDALYDVMRNVLINFTFAPMSGTMSAKFLK